MPDAVNHYYWDTCVFIRFIGSKAGDGFVPQIRQHIHDATSGTTAIYFSTIALAELRPQYFKGSKFGQIGHFLQEFQSAFYPIDPTPDIFIKAGMLRDHKYHNPAAGPPTLKNDKDKFKRTLGTPDAVHLSTCLHLKHDRGIHNIKFHTFDDGKGKNWEGKCVPLLTFEAWTKGISDGLVDAVCALDRKMPTHPAPKMF